MRLSVNAYKPGKEIAFYDREVIEAVAKLHLSLAHGLSIAEAGVDYDEVAGLRFGKASSVGDHLDGVLGRKPAGKIEFELLDRPSDIGVASHEAYHAMAVIYAAREFGWSDIDPDRAEGAFSDDECVQDFVDGLASKFDIESVDSYSKHEADDRGFITPAEEAPAPKI